MFQKSKIAVFVFSALIVLYAVGAAFIPRDEGYPALDVFMNALHLVNENYVEAPDMNKVQEGAMRGLIEALDPYSTFLTKAQVQTLEARKDRIAQVGIVLSKRANLIYVVAPVKNGPAAAAGVRPGDYVTSVDGVNVEESSLLEVDSLLRGAPGSTAKITVFRGAQTKPIEIKIPRTMDETVAVASRMLDGRIGLLEVSSLATGKLDQAKVKLKTLLSAGAQKLILDLRDCADGEPASGAELANFFVKGGTIYSSRGRSGETVFESKAVPEKLITDLPLVVLINSSTAGPAEIIAGAFKASGRATVVGEKSFGMGCTQKRIQLKSGALLILATEKFYTPDGRVIENDEMPRETGIKPNVEAPDQDRLQDLLVNAYFDAQDDGAKYKQLQEKVAQEQLDKAVEVLAKGVSPSRRDK
jgi:carboxyl-terminal processing protease